MDKKKSTFIISLLAASLCMLCWGQAQGRTLPREQAAAPTKTIPIDPELRTGTLDNGLTYYVRHNEEPRGQVCFHLVQNSGSILEEDNERGLAHFLEHMCFNGSKHFPGNSMMEWLQGQGIRMGNDFNAATSMDDTIYSIDNVPSYDKGVLDTCLLIIHDWCTDLSFDPREVEQEREVVLEERRSHRGSTIRMYEQIIRDIYPPECRYSDRMPIGNLEVLNSFTPEQVKAYWEKWSRPELQAIVVVGDIDADAMVSAIKERFSDIPAAGPDAPARIEAQVPDNGDNPIVTFAHDKEQAVPVFYIYKKQAVTPKADKIDEDYYWMLFIQRMMDMMIAQRLSERISEPDCPWTDAAIGETDYFLSKTKGSWMGVMASFPDRTEDGLSALYREMLRIERHGFTQAEYDSALKEYLGSLEKASRESGKRSSRSFCTMFDANYLDNEPMPSAAQELELVKAISAEIDVAFINFYCTLMPKSDLTVIGMLPDGFHEPDVLSLLAAVEDETIESYAEKEPPKPLMTDLPDGGSSEKIDGSILGYDIYRLGNGATVYVKDTDFNPDQIQIRCFSQGGTSLYGDGELAEIDDLETVFMLGGMGELSSNELSRSLAGKQLSLSMEIGSLSEGMYGASTVEYFETLLQLVYLGFTRAREDPDAFRSYVSRRLTRMEGEDDNDQTALNDTINKLVYCDNPRTRRLTREEVKGMDYARAMQIARERFADAADFNFIFTGHFDAATMLPLIERYIGSLPSTGAPREHFVNRETSIRKGRRSSRFSREMETPVAASVRIFSREAAYTLRQNMVHELMGQCLTVILEREIREKEGATYSISAKANFTAAPSPLMSLQTFYQTDPERVDEVERKVDAILKEFAAKGPDKETLEQIVEYKMKRYDENSRTNAWHSTILREYLETGVDFATEYIDVVKSITGRELARNMRRLLRSGNEVDVIMTGCSE